MKAVLLSVHVVAAILFVGPSAVAASMFPRFVPGQADASTAVAGTLHRITRVYGLLGLVVPIVGIALAVYQGRMTEIWVLVAMGLTALAGGLLALQIYPRQREALTGAGGPDVRKTLGMLAGVYNLIWVVVVVLMIARPGSMT